MAFVESKTLGSRAFTVCNYVLLCVIMLLTLYPCWYVLMASFSDPVALYRGSRLLIWPRGFSLEAYRLVLRHAMLWKSYKNTLIYVSLSLVLGLSCTLLGSYVLSRRYLPGKTVILRMITLTMFFGGGMIPTYLVVVGLGIVNTRWAMVFPGLISTYNLIMMMTYFRGIPTSLEESARLDGANDLIILIKIMIPLALPVIAVIALYIIVGNWKADCGTGRVRAQEPPFNTRRASREPCSVRGAIGRRTASFASDLCSTARKRPRVPCPNNQRTRRRRTT